MYSIPAKCPKSKGLQGQQSTSAYSSLALVDLTGCRFLAQEQISGSSKIPTEIYYDRTGKVRAVGAEATKESVYEIAEEENWVKAEW